MTDIAVAWGETTTGARIPPAIRKRLSVYETLSIRKPLLAEYEADGWVKDRELKKTYRIRRPKRHDIAFEDRTWAAFAKLGFDVLNSDRSFRIPYGERPNENKQVDVFAMDNEVVLVVECKSSENIQRSTFKNEVDAIRGRMTGIGNAIRQAYPDRKIKYVLATNNFVISPDSVERIKSAGIVHMPEDVISYYLDLADHLGRAARYQLLGSLFAGTKIPNLESRVPAIQCKMGGRTYYSFAIEPARLLKMSYVLHRNKANSELMPTYQRLIKKSRLSKVSKFVDSGGFFPNSLIINIEDNGRGPRFEPTVQSVDGPRLGILHLPQTYRAAYIVDGQHRLYGYAESSSVETDLIPVVAFIGLPRSEQVSLFMQINENQQAVPKGLRNTLNADLLWESEDLREQAKALKLRVAHHLGESKSSPLFQRVVVGEEKNTNTRCLTIEAISLGLDQGNFLGSFSKNEIKELGTFHRGDNESTYRSLTNFFELCFDYLRRSLPEQYNLGRSEGGFVFINNGVQSYIRILSDIVDHLVIAGACAPRKDTSAVLFSQVEAYLAPLMSYLSSVSIQEGLDMRRQYGSAGKVRYWRRLQLAINEALPSFDPPGLAEFKLEEAKTYNTESFELIRDIEQFLKNDIRRRLQDHFGNAGNAWFKKGVPQKIILAASNLAVQKNMDRDDSEEVEPWDCLHLIDYQEILTKDHSVWQEIFADAYTRPSDRGSQGAWKSKLSWLVDLNKIRNENAHSYSVKEDEYQFLVALHEWLMPSHGS